MLKHIRKKIIKDTTDHNVLKRCDNSIAGLFQLNKLDAWLRCYHWSLGSKWKSLIDREKASLIIRL